MTISPWHVPTSLRSQKGKPRIAGKGGGSSALCVVGDAGGVRRQGFNAVTALAVPPALTKIARRVHQRQEARGAERGRRQGARILVVATVCPQTLVEGREVDRLGQRTPAQRLKATSAPWSCSPLCWRSADRSRRHNESPRRNGTDPEF